MPTLHDPKDIFWQQICEQSAFNGPHCLEYPFAPPSPPSPWPALFHQPRLLRVALLDLILLISVLGVTAVQEFATRGRGTPIPFDPPQHLVTSGIYRYCASPMQLSCLLVLLLWAALLKNPWLLLAAAISAAFSAGVAHWDESEDLAVRFGDAWKCYRSAVPSWTIRWRPYVDPSTPPATLYLAATCGPCSEIRHWLESRNPTGLRLCDAETLPSSSIVRLRYVPNDGSAPDEGVAAFARALEHLNIAYAFAGFILRLPIVRPCLQLLIDASGLGPRTLKTA